MGGLGLLRYRLHAHQARAIATSAANSASQRSQLKTGRTMSGLAGFGTLSDVSAGSTDLTNTDAPPNGGRRSCPSKVTRTSGNLSG